jgi:hypothetical protein
MNVDNQGLKELHGNVLQDQNSVGFESMRYMGSVN